MLQFNKQKEDSIIILALVKKKSWCPTLLLIRHSTLSALLPLFLLFLVSSTSVAVGAARNNATNNHRRSATNLQFHSSPLPPQPPPPSPSSSSSSSSSLIKTNYSNIYVVSSSSISNSNNNHLDQQEFDNTNYYYPSSTASPPSPILPAQSGPSTRGNNNRVSNTLILPSYFEYAKHQQQQQASSILKSSTELPNYFSSPRTVAALNTPSSGGSGSSSSSGISISRKLSQQFGISSTPDVITYQSPWTWSCYDGISCTRQLKNASEPIIPIDVCWLTCGHYGPLWPLPTIKTILTKTVTPFYPQNVEITNIFAPSAVVKAMLGFAGNTLLDRLFRLHPKSEGNSVFPTRSGGKRIEYNIVTISLTTQNSDSKLGLTTDESYSLTIAPYYEGQGQRLHVEINGASFYGVRHGLESLSQLIAYDETNDCLQIVSQAIIHDQPVFPYRGLMIDTARNFIPIKHLKRMVDAMSQNKLNVLHWHITDTNSFPFYSKSVPQMTKYGAYSKSQIYTPNEVKEFVLYARLKGVKILPELDAPAHAGNGWQWGPLEGLGELAMCVNAEPWRQYCGQPPCGQLNPLNRFTYILLGEIYRDFLEVFDKDLFHMGGDEIYFQCWSNDPTVQQWQRNQSTYDLMHLWGFFQDSAYDKLKEANNGNPITPIVWTSDMTTRGRNFLSPSDYIIQVWSMSTSHEIKELINEKYRLIFSNLESNYLDHGFGTWLGKEHFYQFKTWQELYDNDLKSIVDYHMGTNNSREIFRNGQILGGEATLWAEKVDEHNMEMKLWPRSAAFAERMWTHPAKRTDSVYPRLLHHRQRMVKNGVNADRLQPESCHQINGFCTDPYSVI